ncbi:Uncharacterised protein [Mycobacterium tuberculosis]|nr:Uncharacterised protein [Mycobacterium tuberculosis]
MWWTSGTSRRWASASALTPKVATSRTAPGPMWKTAWRVWTRLTQARPVSG